MDDEDREFHFDASTLVGDLRDAMLAELKDAADGRPWNERPEVQQRAVVDRIHSAARGMVNQAVLLMSNKGFPALLGELVQVVIKDEIRVQVNFPARIEGRHELSDQRGKEVVLVLATSEAFRGTRGAVPITPDQPPLPYATEAARVADAAETPPEGWDGEDGEGGDPVSEEGEDAAEDPPIITAAEPLDDGMLIEGAERPTFASVLDKVAAFTPRPVAGNHGVWYCWRDGAGEIRCVEDAAAAEEIARRQAEQDDAKWDTAEDRARPAAAEPVA